MLIEGEWVEGESGQIVPIVTGLVLDAADKWHEVPLLIDTGADRTVLSARALGALKLDHLEPVDRFSGIGGFTESVEVATTIRLPRADGGEADFHGGFAAFLDPAALEISVLGRDVLKEFAVVVDQPNGVVALVRDRHRCRIEQVT